MGQLPLSRKEFSVDISDGHVDFPATNFDDPETVLFLKMGLMKYGLVGSTDAEAVDLLYTELNENADLFFEQNPEWEQIGATVFRPRLVGNEGYNEGFENPLTLKVLRFYAVRQRNIN